MLTSLHFEVPQQKVLLVLELPVGFREDHEVVENLGEVERLWREGMLLGALVYERGSPLAKSTSQARQVSLLAKIMACVCMAHRHYDPNRAASEELAAICRSYPLMLVSAASCGLLPGTPLSPLDPGNWATRGEPVGKGDLPHTIAKVEELVYRVCTDETTRSVTTDAPLAERSRVLVVIAPMAPKRDPRFVPFAEEIEGHLGSDGPAGRPLLIGANGCSDGSVRTRFFAQVGCLQGLAVSELGCLPLSEPPGRGRGRKPKEPDGPVPEVGVGRRRGRPLAL
jgi:hypothetical protein